MNRKSSLVYTSLIGILLILTLGFATIMTFIGAQNSGEFGQSLGGALVFALMLIVDIFSVGLMVLTTLISVICHLLNKMNKLAVNIVFSVIYYLSVVASGYLTVAVGLDSLFNLPVFIIILVLFVLVIVFTSLNLKKAVEESREY